MSIAEKLTTVAENEQKVFDAGKKQEWSDFWDIHQQNGTRKSYYRAFANHTNNVLCWNESTFRPKYDIEPTDMAQGFMSLDIEDFEAHLDDCGVIFNSSNCTNFQQVFQSARFTVFPELNLQKATNTGQIFNNCTALKTIRKIVVSETTPALSSAFANCSKLANVIMEGIIAKSISFSASPLTVESMRSIISCLKNYKGTDSEFTYTLTLKDSCKTSLEADTETVELDGVSYTYFELIAAKGWNLA